MLLWAGLIVAGLVLLRGVSTGEVQPLFLPTPTATRSVTSYREEGQAFFEAGNLDLAIQAYQDALAVDPTDFVGWAELARIQAYSSSTLTQENKRVRLQEALDSIETALDLNAESSIVHAVRAFVLDWSAGAAGSAAERQAFLAQASTAALLARQLDNRNVLALAYQAEVFVDQQQYTQAFQYAELALSLEPNSLDTRRVYAYVLEASGEYGAAIDQYKGAAEVAPNLTFLYISIGQNYRQLGLYDQALEYFDRAASINAVLGIEDPLPYVAIAKTYSRQGEFFAAAANALRALEINPIDPDLYGQLGIIYFRSRNYESSVPTLKCAVEGCTAEENEEADVAVVGMALDDATLPYYYTYGSVTAALEICDVSLPILDQLSAAYSEDPLVMGIVQENYNICR
ncbi:MAG: tetratricopeptide repeat protein [Chloroflexi bacterium]|nr:tetratricopeptide repeat protein [Chloroflexota bacterium]